jgi:hypothetical protein
MEMYPTHLCLNFLTFLKYIKNAFQIKGAYAPGSKKVMSNFPFIDRQKLVLLIWSVRKNNSSLHPGLKGNERCGMCLLILAAA